MVPANFQHLHADTRIGSSFATAIQSCKSGEGMGGGVISGGDRTPPGQERMEGEEECIGRPTNPGFT